MLITSNENFKKNDWITFKLFPISHLKPYYDKRNRIEIIMKPAKIEANFIVSAGGIRKDSKNKLWHSFALEAGHSCREFAIKSLWTSPQDPVRRTNWQKWSCFDTKPLRSNCTFRSHWNRNWVDPSDCYASHTIIIFYLFCKTRKENNSC